MSGQMDVRFILSWVALSVVTQGAVQWWLVSRPSSPLFLQRELVLLLTYLDLPLAQGLALRLAGITWARQWFVVTLAGFLMANAIAGALAPTASAARSTVAWFLLWTVFPGLVVAGLQWYVLRGRLSRPGLWWIVAAASIATTLAIRWALTGTALPGARFGLSAQLVLMTAPAVVLGLGLAWLLRESCEPSPAARQMPVWFVIEWTTAITLAVMLFPICARFFAAATGAGSGAAERWLYIVLPALAGLIISASQWWVLRGRIAIGVSWIVASTLAMAIPTALSVLPQLLPVTGYLWFYLIVLPPAFAAVGAWFGAVQWFLLRRHVRGAWLWVPASALGSCAWYLRYVSYAYGDFLIMGVAAGLVTGVAMAFLLRSANRIESEAG